MGVDIHVAPDPGAFSARLRDFRWWLFRGVLISRVAILLGLGVIVPDERSVHGGGLFLVIIAVWVAALVWVALPLLWMRRVFDHLEARPRLVWADVAALAVLLGVGGGWRNPFYLYAWSPFGLASVVWPARRIVVVIVAGCTFQVASFVVWHSGGWDPAARHVDVSAWASPLLGYIIVGGSFGYVRRRFDDLAHAAAAYDERASEAIGAARAAAAAAERVEVAYRLHRRLCQVFPALGLRLADLGAEAQGDQGAVAELLALSAVVAQADATLEAVVVGLRRDQHEGTYGPGTFGTGRDSPGFIG